MSPDSVNLHDLYALPQWVVSDVEKIPHDPKTGRYASVSDRTTWATADEAKRVLNGRFTNAGFVFTADDPFCGIDIDLDPGKPPTELQRWVLDSFDSYTERSQSGRGFHIIVKGRVPSGIHTDEVEIYSEGRYFIMTGNVVKDVPIRDCQALLDQLYARLKPAPTVAVREGTDDGDEDELLSDAALVDMAMAADNASKFNALCGDGWEQLTKDDGSSLYPSPSEADYALLSILAFYTPNDRQVRRLFRYSNLAKRADKKRPDRLRHETDRLIDFALGKIRAAQGSPVDATALTARLEQAVVSRAEVALPPLTFPPGFVGALATYIIAFAILPVPEIAIAGALALVAGIAGRQYNTPGAPTGLNGYWIVIAASGVGKCCRSPWMRPGVRISREQRDEEWPVAAATATA